MLNIHNVLLGLNAIIILFLFWITMVRNFIIVSPSNIYVASYGIVWISFIMISHEWTANIRYYTLFCFSLGSFFFILGDQLATKIDYIPKLKKVFYLILTKEQVRSPVVKQEKKFFINNQALLFCVFMLALSTYGAIVDFEYFAQKQISLKYLFSTEDIEYLRSKMVLLAEEGGEAPLLNKFLRQLAVFQLITPIAFTAWSQYKKDWKKYIYLIFIITCLFLCSLFYLQRMILFTGIFALLFSYLLVSRMLDRKVFYLLFSSMIFIVFFVWFGSFRGGDNINPLQTLFGYLGGSVVGLDAFLCGVQGGNVISKGHDFVNVTTNGPLFYTFGLKVLPHQIKEILINRGIVEANRIMGYHGEFIYYPKTTNIYTHIRFFYESFHIPGIIFMSFFLGFCASILRKIALNSFLKLVIYSYTAYLIITSFGNFRLNIKYLFYIILFVKFINIIQFIRFKHRKSRSNDGKLSTKASVTI